MSLPEESVAVNTLPEVTTIPTGKKLIFTDPDTNEGGIITLENLTKQILQNLTTQTFGLNQGNLTLLQAINQLNSNTSKLALKENVTDIQALISKASSSTYILFHLSGANYTGNDLPIDATYKYGSGIIFYRNSNSCKIVLFPERAKPVWKMANWEKWKDFVNNTVD